MRPILKFVKRLAYTFIALLVMIMVLAGACAALGIQLIVRT